MTLNELRRVINVSLTSTACRSTSLLVLTERGSALLSSGRDFFGRPIVSIGPLAAPKVPDCPSQAVNLPLRGSRTHEGETRFRLLSVCRSCRLRDPSGDARRFNVATKTGREAVLDGSSAQIVRNNGVVGRLRLGWTAKTRLCDAR
jgi:hypothetical protein